MKSSHNEPLDSEINFKKQLETLWQPENDTDRIKKVIAEQVYRITIKYDDIERVTPRKKVMPDYQFDPTCIGDRISANIKMMHALLELSQNEIRDLIKNLVVSINAFYKNQLFSQIDSIELLVKEILLPELQNSLDHAYGEHICDMYVEPIQELKTNIRQFIKNHQVHLTEEDTDRSLNRTLIEPAKNDWIESKAQGNDIKINYRQDIVNKFVFLPSCKIAKLKAEDNSFTIWIKTELMGEIKVAKKERFDFVVDKQIADFFYQQLKKADPVFTKEWVMHPDIYGELSGYVPVENQETFFSVLASMGKGLSKAQIQELKSFLEFTPPSFLEKFALLNLSKEKTERHELLQTYNKYKNLFNQGTINLIEDILTQPLNKDTNAFLRKTLDGNYSNANPKLRL